MLTEQGHAKVMDFGLAKQVATEDGIEQNITADLTQEGTTLGTVAYMSPEQVRGDPLDGRSDIFSFGIVLFEMLTAVHPFRRDRIAESISSILKEQARPLARYLDDPSELLQHTANKMLAKKPGDRFQSVHEIVTNLREVLESFSGESRIAAPSPPSKSLLWVLPTVVSVAALVLWLLWSPSAPELPPADLNPIPLTSYPGREYEPTFSPEGNEVAFTWNGERQDNWDIYVKQIGAEGQMRLTTDPARDRSPTWSPDGLNIAFVRRQTTNRAEICLIPSRGGAERTLAEVISPNWNQSLGWSPDGKYLAVQTKQSASETYAIFLLRIDNGELRRLTPSIPDTPAGLGDRNPAFSADGLTLVFSRQVANNVSRLYLLPLSENYEPEGEPRPLTELAGSQLSPVWTAEGREILYTVDSRLYRIEVSGSDPPRRIVYAGDNCLWPALSPQRDRLAYSRVTSDTNIYRVALSGTSRASTEQNPEPEKWISSTQYDHWPRFSADGTRVLFVSDRTGSQEIWVCESDGSGLRKLTSFDGPRPWRPAWSSDGSQIAFVLYQDEANIFTVDSERGVPKQLTFGPNIDAEPAWSRDGQWIYLGSRASGRENLLKTPFEGGDAVEVITDTCVGACESVDGTTLYCARPSPEGATIWEVPMQGGETRPVLDSLEGSGDFRVTKDGIYFIRRSPAGPSLEFYSFDSGQTEEVLPDFPYHLYSWDVSPDRKWLLATRRDEESDLMLVENFR
jgi:Tol biopolymer transport system component